MKLKVNATDLKGLAPKIERFRSSVVTAAGDTLTRQVKVLSQQQQKSFDDTPFVPLTPRYKARKIKAGHPGVPNLTFTGKFMDRIGLRQDDPQRPYVGPVASFLPQAEGLDKKRKIWGVHPDTVRNMENVLKQMWEGLLR